MNAAHDDSTVHNKYNLCGLVAFVADSVLMKQYFAPLG